MIRSARPPPTPRFLSEMARATGFPREVKELVLVRSRGMCEVMAAPACAQFGSQFHHRRPRAMGGTRRPSTNWASSALYVCGPCHAFIESRRLRALDAGWLVRQSSECVDVAVLWRGRPRYLTPDGGFQDVKKEAS